MNYNNINYNINYNMNYNMNYNIFDNPQNTYINMIMNTENILFTHSQLPTLISDDSIIYLYNVYTLRRNVDTIKSVRALLFPDKKLKVYLDFVLSTTPLMDIDLKDVELYKFCNSEVVRLYINEPCVER